MLLTILNKLNTRRYRPDYNRKYPYDAAGGDSHWVSLRRNRPSRMAGARTWLAVVSEAAILAGVCAERL